MSGRDHETGIDGHCMPQCRECKIERLEKTIKLIKDECSYYVETKEYTAAFREDQEFINGEQFISEEILDIIKQNEGCT